VIDPWTLASEKLADAVAGGEGDEEVLFGCTGLKCLSPG
jgi:hypothetical protein